MESSFPPPVAPTVGELVASAHAETAEQFEATLGPAVLVGPRELSADREGDDPWAFNTASLGSAGQPVRDPEESFRESEVFGVKKAKAGPFADTVLVGRSSSNDVCIADPSLSKLHARIGLHTDGVMVLTDSDSKNGTWVNGHRLAPREGVELHHGDELRFGTRTLKVYVTARLHTVLKNLVLR